MQLPVHTRVAPLLDRLVAQAIASPHGLAAYKPIEAVMAAQADLTLPVHALKQIIVVKG